MFSPCIQVSPKIFALVAIFSMSSWMNIVGMWVELPIMVDRLPEGWNLPIYMTLIIQLANIGPAIYTIYNKCKGRRQNHNHEVILCFLILLTSISSCLFTSVFWSTTVYINNKLISIPVFILLSFSSLASCTSTLVFLPFMSRFSSQYMFAYYFGQGLSGLVPGVFGLLQGLGGNPTCVNVTNTTTMVPSLDLHSHSLMLSQLKPIYPEPSFSVRVFFLLLTTFLIISLISFSILNMSKLWLLHPDKRENQVVIVNDTLSTDSIPTPTEPITDNDKLLKANNNSPTSSSASSSPPQTVTPPSTSRLTLSFYLVVVFLLNMSINSIIPATQSYTCLSYGNTVYTLTVRLSSLFNSAFSLLSMFIPKPSLPILAFLTTTALSILTFHLTIASYSPHPPFTDTIYGPILIVRFTFLLRLFCQVLCF